MSANDAVSAACHASRFPTRPIGEGEATLTFGAAHLATMLWPDEVFSKSAWLHGRRGLPAWWGFYKEEDRL